MLQGRSVHPTIPAADLERAKAYADRLGLTPSRELSGGLVYETGGGAWFLLCPSQGAGTAQHTVAGWEVEDIDAEVAELKARGVVFEEYDLPQLKTGHVLSDGEPHVR
jgi:catechol 2,3-dioxygenase-like lactoylglutathione lyase family enzyme